jgi:hypothetical protein
MYLLVRQTSESKSPSILTFKPAFSTLLSIIIPVILLNLRLKITLHQGRPENLHTMVFKMRMLSGFFAISLIFATTTTAILSLSKDQLPPVLPLNNTLSKRQLQVPFSPTPSSLPSFLPQAG